MTTTEQRDLFGSHIIAKNNEFILSDVMNNFNTNQSFEAIFESWKKCFVKLMQNNCTSFCSFALEDMFFMMDFGKWSILHKFRNKIDHKLKFIELCSYYSKIAPYSKILEMHYNF